VFLLDDDEGQGQQRVFFSSDPDGDWEIYTMRPNGTDVLHVTVNVEGASSPAWSPDGTRIAFTSGGDGDSEIYTMRSHGTDVRQLTANDAGVFDPAWSP